MSKLHKLKNNTIKFNLKNLNFLNLRKKRILLGLFRARLRVWVRKVSNRSKVAMVLNINPNRIQRPNRFYLRDPRNNSLRKNLTGTFCLSKGVKLGRIQKCLVISSDLKQPSNNRKLKLLGAYTKAECILWVPKAF